MRPNTHQKMNQQYKRKKSKNLLWQRFVCRNSDWITQNDRLFAKECYKQVNCCNWNQHWQKTWIHDGNDEVQANDGLFCSQIKLHVGDHFVGLFLDDDIIFVVILASFHDFSIGVAPQ